MLKRLSNALVRGLVFAFVVLAPAAASAAAPPSMQRIDAANAYPLSPIVHIVSTFSDGATFQGSGTMIDRYHVLTAGHVVYNAAHSTAGWPVRVSVYAGQTGEVAPFGVATGTYFRTFQSFMADDKTNAEGHTEGDGDIGMITLDRPLGDQTGWYKIGYVANDAYFAGRILNTAGYPAQQGYDGTQMYRQNGPTIGAKPGTSAVFEAVEWSTDVMTSIPGQSGSGIYDYDTTTDTRTVVAVLDLGDQTTHRGYGEVITKSVYDAIQVWLAEDKVG